MADLTFSKYVHFFRASSSVDVWVAAIFDVIDDLIILHTRVRLMSQSQNFPKQNTERPANVTSVKSPEQSYFSAQTQVTHQTSEDVVLTPSIIDSGDIHLMGRSWTRSDL